MEKHAQNIDILKSNVHISDKENVLRLQCYVQHEERYTETEIRVTEMLE